MNTLLQVIIVFCYIFATFLICLLFNITYNMYNMYNFVYFYSRY